MTDQLARRVIAADDRGIAVGSASAVHGRGQRDDGAGGRNGKPTVVAPATGEALGTSNNRVAQGDILSVARGGNYARDAYGTRRLASQAPHDFSSCGYLGNRRLVPIVCHRN